MHNVKLPHQSRGKDGVVRIETHGGLDNPGSNPSWDVIFQTHLNWP